MFAGVGASPSHPQTRRSAKERADPRPVRARHGRQAEEDPGPLQEMPRGRSRRTRGRTQRPRQEVTGKPDDIERVTSGLAGGRRERSRKTTSPAAYPTTIPFVVSKFVEGTDLAGRLKRAPFSHREAAGLVATVAEALHYAHSRHLFHRDVKPANILIGPSGRPYV